MARDPNPIILADLRGGLNVKDSPLSLAENQVVLAENIDWSRSTLGGRRPGHTPIRTSQNLVFLYRYLPDQVDATSRLFTVQSGANNKFAYWTDVVQAFTVSHSGTDNLDESRGLFLVDAQELHGKVFVAYPSVSGTDRLHMFASDGSTIRRTGLKEPAAPNVANQGTGSLIGTRYYRVRYAEVSGVVTLRLSEPSDATTFTPSGSGENARITKPAAISEGETHWWVEASVDGTNFYHLSTVAVGTTTYDDDSTLAEIVEDETRLSPNVGQYTLQYSAKFLSADNDRLLMASAWEDDSKASRVTWTPVGAEPGGFGNDERIDETVDPFLDLDGASGGGLTAFKGPINGYHYAFKMKRIYKLVRTYSRKQAYQALPITDAFGAIPRSVVKGVDEAGRPCLYFLDLDAGPCRVTVQGVERCGYDILPLWKTVNKDADLVGHGVYYADRNQVMWDVATVGSSLPNLRIKLQVDQQVPSRHGARNGWSVDTGPYVATLASEMYADPPMSATRGTNLKPLYAVASGTPTVSGLVQYGVGTTDVGLLYRSRVRTKPYLPGGLFAQTKVTTGTVAGLASESDVWVRLTRDYGVETLDTTVDMRPSPEGEGRVVRAAPDCDLSEFRTLQVEYGDQYPIDHDWELDAIGLLPSADWRQ